MTPYDQLMFQKTDRLLSVKSAEMPVTLFKNKNQITLALEVTHKQLPDRLLGQHQRLLPARKYSDIRSDCMNKYVL